MEVHSNSFHPSKFIIFCHVGVNEVAFVDPINLLKVHGQPEFINVRSNLKNIEELCLVPRNTSPLSAPHQHFSLD